MLASVAFVFTLLMAIANAHFEMQFPPPRGQFNDDDEVKFCDGYNSVGNRSTFPLDGGFFSMKSSHSPWTVGVIVATADNPTSFNDFSQLVPFFQYQQAGIACFPLSFPPINGTSFRDGQNVTVQIVFDGGDGKLYQCADLTLSSSVKISSNVSCTNSTTNGSGSATQSGSPSATQASGTVGEAMPRILIVALVSILSTMLVL